MADKNSPSDDGAWHAASGLWLQLFGEPPPVRCEAEVLFGVMVANLAPAGPYVMGALPGLGSGLPLRKPHDLPDHKVEPLGVGVRAGEDHAQRCRPAAQGVDDVAQG